MSSNVKSLLMILALLTGAFFSDVVTLIDNLSGGTIAPILLFTMLFITFCCVDLRELKFSMLHVWIVLFQVAAAVGSYFLLLPFGQTLAQGVMVCFVTPIAMAAVVIGQMLGAKVVTIASFSMFCNVVLAIFIPFFFTHIGSEGCTFLMILAKVGPLMVLPPILAQLLRCTVPAITSWFGARGYLSFYIWLFSVTISIGRTMAYVLDNLEEIEPSLIAWLSLGALAACIIQYSVGRYLGVRYGDLAAGQQSLGQKNTILAIWMAQMFLSPIASIAPTAYVLWQNLVNSYLVFKHKEQK